MTNEQEQSIKTVIKRHPHERVRTIEENDGTVRVEMFDVNGYKSKAVVIERDGATRNV